MRQQGESLCLWSLEVALEHPAGPKVGGGPTAEHPDQPVPEHWVRAEIEEPALFRDVRQVEAREAGEGIHRDWATWKRPKVESKGPPIP
jgi:hypothetical protein